MILLIDNYDSFVNNLARYFRQLGVPTCVVRHDALLADEVQRWTPQAIVLSPGPCGPEEAGCSLDIVRRWQGEIPILGVCLGHQVIARALGGSVVRNARPVHGSASRIWHRGGDLYDGIPNPFRAGRYHSLIVEADSLPPALHVTAWLDDGTVMGVADANQDLVGWQFHPESMLTECGYQLLNNFLNIHRIERSVQTTCPEVFSGPDARTRLPIHALRRAGAP